MRNEFSRSTETQCNATKCFHCCEERGSIFRLARAAGRTYPGANNSIPYAGLSSLPPGLGPFFLSASGPPVVRGLIYPDRTFGPTSARPNSDIPPLFSALTVESTSCVELKQKTPRKRGLDTSKPGIVVELDARHALLDEGTLLHRMNSEVLR